MAIDALLTHCRLADGRLVDIGIAGGRIATIGEDTAPFLSNRVSILDIGGELVLPGLVDGHMHLDKTLMGLPWLPHMAGPTRMSRIETDKRVLPQLAVSTEERAGNLIEACVARHRASAHPCRHRSRKPLVEPRRRAGGARALLRPCERADRRLSAERRHALPRRPRPARRGAARGCRSRRRHRPVGG